jgi:hypothetical protein
MPVTQDKKTGKWRVGRGKAQYDTKAKAEEVQRAIYAKKGKK